ncbi:MAG: hypothetical protein SU899_04210 [Chloroflexota bacterium]|nr:hypothetical protein [Chloroflexota bacterium]
MAERIFQVEREADGEVVIRIRPDKFVTIPKLARSHLWAAEKESLLALRSLIDASIEQVEKKSKKRKREKVEVE